MSEKRKKGTAPALDAPIDVKPRSGCLGGLGRVC